MPYFYQLIFEVEAGFKNSEFKGQFMLVFSVTVCPTLLQPVRLYVWDRQCSRVYCGI